MSAGADARAVMTLDAGGTNFVFSAMRGNQDRGGAVRAAGERRQPGAIAGAVSRRGSGRCGNRSTGRRRPSVSRFPVRAITSADIVIRPGNLPAYRDVPLTAILEDTFGLPTFINNDGDLFAYGEASAGFLPYVNGLLEKAGSPKRFRNLLGITLGTGFGGGLVRDGQLIIGDNSAAGEVWLLRNKLRPRLECGRRRVHSRGAPGICGADGDSVGGGAAAEGRFSRSQKGRLPKATERRRAKRSGDWEK